MAVTVAVFCWVAAASAETERSDPCNPYFELLEDSSDSKTAEKNNKEAERNKKECEEKKKVLIGNAESGDQTAILELCLAWGTGKKTIKALIERAKWCERAGKHADWSSPKKVVHRYS